MDHILLIRHAQTPANALGLMNADGDTEPVLTEQGERDARAMAERLADAHLDGIVCTARLRTRRTAELVGGGRTPAPEIVCVPELSEIVAGAFAGRPLDEYRAWVRERPLTEAPDGGESMTAAAARYAAGMELVAGMPHRGLLAVLHNLPLRMIANVLAGEDPVRGRMQRFEQDQVLRIDRDRLAGAAATLGAWAEEARAGGRTVTSTWKGR